VTAAIGLQRIALDPESQLGSGVFLVRLSHGGASFTRRICVVE
jgi:hypothetical protein